MRAFRSPGFLVAAVILIVVMAGPVLAMLVSVAPASIIAAFSTPPARDALGVSLLASTIAIGIASVLGIPAGFAIAHAPARWRGWALFALALPLAFPPVASGIILLQSIGTRAPLGSWLASHGIVFVDSLWGVVLAELFVAGSFVAIAATAAFGALDPIYEDSARTLGASEQALFFRVALPLAAPNVLAGVLLAWMRAVGEYGATSIVAYHPTSLPIALYVTLSAAGIGPALALSYGFVVLAVIVVGVQWALRHRVV